MDLPMPLRAVVIWLVFINVTAILMTMTDKAAAMAGNRRVRERTLFVTGILGGATMMFVTMLIIRHKTKHKRFMIGLPLIMTVQYIVAFILYKYAPLFL